MKNTVFEEMETALKTYNEKKDAHEAKKQTIINEFGWDSEELKAWYGEKEAMKVPYSQGERQAYQAYTRTTANGEETIEMNDHLWDRDVEDFLTTLRKAEVEEFIYTNHSTAVMDNLHEFEKYGAKVVGLATIQRNNCRWGVDEIETIRGIRIAL